EEVDLPGAVREGLLEDHNVGRLVQRPIPQQVVPRGRHWLEGQHRSPAANPLAGKEAEVADVSPDIDEDVTLPEKALDRKRGRRLVLAGCVHVPAEPVPDPHLQPEAVPREDAALRARQPSRAGPAESQRNQSPSPTLP